MVSIPKPRSPAFDSTGLFADVNQQDPNVFFLCQTIEGSEEAPIRKAIVPKGHAIFMPIINWLSVMGVDGENEFQLSAVAKVKMDLVSDLILEVNGKKVRQPFHEYRVMSGYFSADLPDDNILDLPAGTRGFVSDGYWVCIPHITERTTISTFGACSSGATKIRVIYDLNVAQPNAHDACNH